jgi:short-subunit dehydrogenase
LTFDGILFFYGMTLYTLITGASSGIGFELAKIFAQNGHPLILTARSTDRLEAIAKDLRSRFQVEIHVVPADLSQPQGPKKLFGAIQKKKLAVENLVNNAGFATHGRFVDIPWEKERAMLQLNIISLVELTHLFLPAMQERRGGAILNVASIAAFQPGPFMTNYYASKAHVLFFSEGLAVELKPYNISVTVLCPGPAETAFFDVAGMRDSKLVKSPLIMSAEKVAQIGYDGFLRKKLIVIPGFFNRFMASSVGFMPRFIVRNIAGRLNR